MLRPKGDKIYRSLERAAPTHAQLEQFGSHLLINYVVRNAHCHAKNERRWYPVAKQMVHAWNDGMASLRSQKNLSTFRGLDGAIAAAGFSDAEKPVIERAIVGRSALLDGSGKM